MMVLSWLTPVRSVSCRWVGYLNRQSIKCNAGAPVYFAAVTREATAYPYTFPGSLHRIQTPYLGKRNMMTSSNRTEQDVGEVKSAAVEAHRRLKREEHARVVCIEVGTIPSTASVIATVDAHTLVLAFPLCGLPFGDMCFFAPLRWTCRASGLRACAARINCWGCCGCCDC